MCIKVLEIFLENTQVFNVVFDFVDRQQPKEDMSASIAKSSRAKNISVFTYFFFEASKSGHLYRHKISTSYVSQSLSVLCTTENRKLIQRER